MWTSYILKQISFFFNKIPNSYISICSSNINFSKIQHWFIIMKFNVTRSKKISGQFKSEWSLYNQSNRQAKSNFVSYPYSFIFSTQTFCLYLLYNLFHSIVNVLIFIKKDFLKLYNLSSNFAYKCTRVTF